MDKALQDVNKRLKTTQSSLKDVDRLLKLDPSNTELLSQKQRLLSDAIENTEQKLTTLKEASVQAKATLERGDLGQDKYDALQREIVATESSLEKLKSQAQTTDATLKSSGGGLKSLGEAAESASGKVSGVSKAAGGLAAGAAATVPATQELRRDLSFLEENAKGAKVGMNTMETAFKTFNAVSGETDSSVEAVSNLLQAGFTESNLQQAVEGVSGAMSRFPDTLKIESLADSIQETVATGKSIGQFGEFLDRVGIGASNFDEDLSKCNTTAEKTDLVLKTLSETGMNDVYTGWRKNNEALADYDDAMIDMQMALGDLAESIAPVVTALAEGATKALDLFNKLPQGAKAVVGSMVGITAAAAPTLSAVGKVTQGIDALKGSSEKAGIVSKGLSAAQKSVASALSVVPAPAAAAAGALVVVGTAIYSAYQSTHEYTNAAKEMSEVNDQNVASIEATSEKAEFYAGQLDQLSEKENKTAQDKQLIQSYVDQLNESVDGLNLAYDAEADKLSETTDAIYTKIDAMKQEALQAAYVKQSQAALDKYAESQIKTAEAQEKLKTAQEAYDKAAESGYVSQKLSTDLAQAEAEYNDLKTATGTYWTEYVRQSNAAAMQSGQWDKLVEEAGLAGKDIPKSLTDGIKAGQYAVPTTVEELKALIQFDELANKAGVSGSKTVQELSSKLAAGEITAQEAAAQLSNAVDQGLGTAPAKARGKGDSAGKQFAGGVSSTKGNASGAGKAIGSAAASGAASANFSGAGYNDGLGYARGLRNAITVVANAGAAIARAALAAAKKESDQHSPSKKWAAAALMDVRGYTESMWKQVPKVEKAGQGVALAAMTGAKSVTMESLEGLNPINDMSANIVQQFDYNQMYAAMKAAVSESKFSISIDGREFARVLRGVGVNMN